MKKNIKKVMVVSLVGTMGISMLCGCGKKDEGVNASARKIVEYNVSDYVQSLGAYTGLTVAENITIVTDADVQAQIDSLVSQNTTQQSVERESMIGDTLVISYNRVAEGADIQDETDYSIKLGSATKGEEFDNNLIGLSTGDTTTFTISEEVKDSETNETSTVEATYTVNVSDVKEDVVPEVTDTFISENSDYATVDEYKEGTKKELEESNASTANNTAKSDLLQQVIDASTVTGTPAFLFNLNYNMMCQSYAQYGSYFGYDLESYLEMCGSSLEDIKKESVTMCIQTLVIEAIANDAGIEVTDEVFEEQVKEVYGVESVDEILKKYSKEEITYDIRRDLVLDYLYENNTVNQSYVSADSAE